MDIISERLSIVKEDNLFSAVILPTGKKKTKLYMLFAWLMAWTFCGIIFFTSYINLSAKTEFNRMQHAMLQKEAKKTEAEKKAIFAEMDKQWESLKKQRVILIVIIGFWIYFEFKIGRAYVFRRFGKENIWVKNGRLFYWRKIIGKGKIKEFDVTLINDFRVLTINKGDFFTQVQESFWVIGGERLAFSYAAKQVMFGLQLTDEEAEVLFKRLSQVIKQKSVSKA